MKLHDPRRIVRSAYTLVEVLVASSVAMFVVGGSLWLLVAGMRSATLATSGSINDLAQWGIASRLWVDARIANGITIYPSYSTTHVERWLRRVVNDGGNLLVFSLSTPVSDKTRYTKITGYYFTPVSSTVLNSGTIYRFDYNVSASDQASFKPLEDILKDNRTAIMNSATIVAGSVNTFMNSSVTIGSVTTSFSSVFLSRSAGTAATLACSVSAGSATQKTLQQKVIEATFFIRG